MAPKGNTGASAFLPDNFGVGGSLIDDVDCTIVGAKVVTGEDTPFENADDRCFLELSFQPDPVDGEDQELKKEYYGIGKTESFQPSKDGKALIVDEGKKINKNSKTAIFFTGLFAAGFPPADVPDDNSVSYLEGMHVHVNRVLMPDMKNSKPRPGQKPNADPPTVLVVTKLLGEAQAAAAPAKGKKGAAAPAAAPKAAAAAKAAPKAAAPAADEELAGEVEMALVQHISESGGSVQKKGLAPVIMAWTDDQAKRAVAFKLIGSAAWLSDEARPWSYDPASLTLSIG